MYQGVVLDQQILNGSLPGSRQRKIVDKNLTGITLETRQVREEAQLFDSTSMLRPFRRDSDETHTWRADDVRIVIALILHDVYLWFMMPIKRISIIRFASTTRR